MAYSYFKMKKYGEAEKIFKSIGKLGGEFGELANFYGGVVFFESGKYAEAIKRFEAYLAGRGKEKRELASFNISQCYFNLGKYEKAREILSRLKNELKYSSLRNNVIFSLAEILVIERKNSEAIKVLHEIDKKSSRWVEALVRIGDILATQKKLEEALKYYKMASNRKHGSVAALKGGKLLKKMGRSGEALELFKLVSRKNQISWREAQFNIASIKYAEKKYKEAAEIVEKLSKSGVAYKVKSENLLGAIYVEMGELEKAEKLLQSIVTNHGDNPVVVEAYMNLAKLYEKRKKYQKSVDYLIKAQEYARSKIEQAEVQKRLGAAYSKLGKNDKAIRAYLKVEILYNMTPVYYPAMLELADLYLKIGRKSDCKKLLNSLLDKANGEIKKEISDRLKKLK
jgi:tetratricopeptide (TPR) repeat protein